MTRRRRRVWVVNHIFGDSDDLEVRRTIDKERSKREQLNSFFISNQQFKRGRKNSAGTYPVPLQIQNRNSLHVGAGARCEVPGAQRRQTVAAAMQHAELGTPFCATAQIRIRWVPGHARRKRGIPTPTYSSEGGMEAALRPGK
jgi:hypothetical protein